MPEPIYETVLLRDLIIDYGGTEKALTLDPEDLLEPENPACTAAIEDIHVHLVRIDLHVSFQAKHIRWVSLQTRAHRRKVKQEAEAT